MINPSNLIFKIASINTIVNKTNISTFSKGIFGYFFGTDKNGFLVLKFIPVLINHFDQI